MSRQFLTHVYILGDNSATVCASAINCGCSCSYSV